jgi:hypothetical protein
MAHPLDHSKPLTKEKAGAEALRYFNQWLALSKLSVKLAEQVSPMAFLDMFLSISIRQPRRHIDVSC